MPLLRTCACCSLVFPEGQIVRLDDDDRGICNECCSRTARYVLNARMSELAEIWRIDVPDGREAARIADGIGPDVVGLVDSLAGSPAPGAGAVALLRIGLMLEAVALAARAGARASSSQDVGVAEVEAACGVLFGDLLLSEGGLARLRGRIAVRQ
mgnify:CR=1 FL=1